MITFKQFMVEKDISGEIEPTLYITCSLDNDIQSKWGEFVITDEKAVELETEPHCTWFWGKLVKQYDENEIFDVLSPILTDIDVVFKPHGFEIFEGVENGTQDCVVVRLGVSKEVKALNELTKQTLLDNGFEFSQTYPDWKPHMTIGYWNAGDEIQLDEPTDDMLKRVDGKIDYMQRSDGGVKSNVLKFGD